MPRRQRELVPNTPFPSNSLVASATRYTGETARIYNSNDEAWQMECYRHYRICGEARFSAQFFGHALSRAVLYIPSDPSDRRSTRVTEGETYDVLQELFNGSEGQSAMLNAIGVHLTIAGECYLIGRESTNDDTEDPTQVWEVRSILEVKSNGVKGKAGKWWIKQGGNQADIVLQPTDTVIRIWIPDPLNAINADSPFRSLLPILEEIEWLTRYVFAQCSQRLAGAGLLLVPEEMEFPAAPGQEGKDLPKAEGFMMKLADAMLTPIKDPSNPASKIPVVATAPGDVIDKMKWLTFWSELDVEAKALRQEAIQRFALGMDLPPERILGMSSGNAGGTGGGRGGGVSHWGQWQIDEDTIKMHIEPMLDVVVNALAVFYLRPGASDPTASIYYDTTLLRLRPDRSKESLELYDRGLIKADVVVKENGFDASEMMDDKERRIWFLMKVAGGSATPQMVAEALQILGVDIPVPLDSPSTVINETRPDPSIKNHPNRDLPERATLLAAGEGLVYRALERVGNRLRQQGVKPDGLRSFEVHTALTLNSNQAKTALSDAWGCAPQVLDGLVEDPAKVTASLDGYVASLLTTGRPHSREALDQWLAAALTQDDQ